MRPPNTSIAESSPTGYTKSIPPRSSRGDESVSGVQKIYRRTSFEPNEYSSMLLIVHGGQVRMGLALHVVVELLGELFLQARIARFAGQNQGLSGGGHRTFKLTR